MFGSWTAAVLRIPLVLVTLLTSVLAVAGAAQAELTQVNSGIRLEFCNEGDTAKLPKRSELTLCQLDPPIPGPPTCPATMNRLQFMIWRDLPSSRPVKIWVNLRDAKGSLLEKATGAGSIVDRRLSSQLVPPVPRQAGDWLQIEFRLPRKVRRLKRGDCLALLANPWVARSGGGS